MATGFSSDLSIGSTVLLEYVDQLIAKGETDFRLNCALKYAKCYPRADLSLRRLASLTNLSVWHICRLFRDEVGISPARCIKLLRLKFAADLLIKTSLSVKEVTASVGINDVSHFVRDFKSVTGEFPVEYRTRVRKQTAVGVLHFTNAKNG